MKIVFICGSLEDGKDGVGDYTRRLGNKLIEEGCSVGMIALHDRYVHGGHREESEALSIKTLRLSAELSWKTRGALVSEFIKKVDPDWISLQFVGFAYQRYGLPFGMGYLLKGITRNRNFHIMFHELWCGMSASVPWKEVVLGKLQYLFVKVMLASLKPAKVFTNTERYARRLREIGEKPLLVPVFSNIPLSATETDSLWEDVVAAHHLQSLLTQSESKLVLGFFGSIYSIPGFAALLKDAQQAAETLGRECCILLIGNNSKEDLVRLSGHSLCAQVFEMGMQSPGIINRAMDLVDFGVVTTPIDGMNKSGGAAAWMERGIPILVSGKDLTYEGQDLKVAYDAYRVSYAGDIMKAYGQKGKGGPRPERLNSVAAMYKEQLINDKAAYLHDADKQL